MLLGVGIPYCFFLSARRVREGEINYRVEQSYGLIFMEGEEAPLTCRCSLEIALRRDFKGAVRDILLPLCALSSE